MQGAVLGSYSRLGVLFLSAAARVLIPRVSPSQLATCAGHCNKGRGPFDEPVAAFCYMTCQAPMHYVTFKMTLDLASSESVVLPHRPLVVDLGCGPATTAMALHDWRVSRGELPAQSYIGIDSSAVLVGLAEELLDSPEFCHASSSVFRYRVLDLRGSEVSAAADGCDGVIFALSYILHQDFLSDLRPLAALMELVRHQTQRLPTWLILQDANFRESRIPGVDVWPETRINELDNLVTPIGYQLNMKKKSFVGPRARINADGDLTIDEPGVTKNVASFFGQIA